jgi:hypothetical protein
MGVCEEYKKKSINAKNNNIGHGLIIPTTYENSIIAEIYIKDNEVNKDIRIINSYEEYFRTERFKKVLISEKMNESQIKKCNIQINEESISFNYFHKFKNQGNYKIKYSFDNSITKANYNIKMTNSLYVFWLFFYN